MISDHSLTSAIAKLRKYCSVKSIGHTAVIQTLHFTCNYRTVHVASLLWIRHSQPSRGSAYQQVNIIDSNLPLAGGSDLQFRLTESKELFFNTDPVVRAGMLKTSNFRETRQRWYKRLAPKYIMARLLSHLLARIEVEEVIHFRVQLSQNLSTSYCYVDRKFMTLLANWNGIFEIRSYWTVN